jgi:hypothetical protein
MERWFPKPWMLPLMIAALVVPASLAFAAAGPAAGLAVGGLTIGILVFLVARASPREPLATGPPEPGEPTLAVVIAPISGRATARRIVELAGRASADGDDAPAVLALAPVRPSAAQRWLSLRGDTRRRAQQRLDEAIETLNAVGANATGRIVDQDPARAVADVAAFSGASAVAFVVADHSEDAAIEKVRDRVERPVHRFEVEAGKTPSAPDRRRSS